jgi:pimeloyl-ACP methyl ester carboxylesterase
MIERRFTTSDGVSLFYRDYGHHAGLPVVICHGIAVSSIQFIDDAKYLAGLGYRVLTPDLRGHGKSGAGKKRPECYSLERLARDQSEMLDHAGIVRVHYVGNSLGGMVGLAMLTRHADRLDSLSTFGTPYRLNIAMPAARHFIALNFRLWRPFVVWLAAFLCSRDWTTQTQIHVMAMFSDPVVLGAVGSAITRFDYRESVVTTKVPIMLMHCHRDWLVGWAMGSTLKAAGPPSSVHFVDLPTGGHCANLDAPEAFRAALLEFWGGLE